MVSLQQSGPERWESLSGCYPERKVGVTGYTSPMLTFLREIIDLSWLNRRVRLPALCLVLFALVLLLSSSPQTRDRIGTAIHGHDHDIVAWELRNFFDKWFSRIASIFDDELSEEGAIAEVREYARLTGEINRVEGLINRAVSLGEPAEDLEVERSDMHQQRLAIESRVEELIEGQVSGILAEAGMSWRVGFLDADGYLFPPVDFKYENSPPVLVISPRDRIELESTRLLTPGLGVGAREDIEEDVEKLDEDYSALVINTGGVATFPAVVGASSNLQYTLRTVAHEWFHHYLVFYPLGRNYWASGEMVTINETVANIAGDEVGDAAYKRYYQEGLPEPPAPTPGPGASPSPAPEPPSFSFNSAMRETRLEADRLLAEGRIEEAEAYMEERRLVLADNGYFLRKLNQAYFACHGSYADRPTAVSPIGGQVRQIRDQSGTLREFIETMSRVSSHEDLLRLVDGE